MDIISAQWVFVNRTRRGKPASDLFCTTEPAAGLVLLYKM